MFNKRLRELRVQHKYTQQYMADLLGVTLNAYQKYEQAERTPSFATHIQLADFFNVSTDFLLGRDEYLKTQGLNLDCSDGEV